MSFKKIKDNENLKSVISFNDVEIGLYPVVYGYRVRVSEKDNWMCLLDLCGGDNLEMIDLLYNGIKTILEGQFRENNKFDFREFPIQEIKPFYKDMNFLKEFTALILKYRETFILDKNFQITQEKLNDCRLKYNLNTL